MDNEQLAQTVATSEVELASLVERASHAYLAAHRIATEHAAQGLTADQLEMISRLGAGYAVDLARAAHYISWARSAGAPVPDGVERMVLQMCINFVLVGTLASDLSAVETLQSLSHPAEIGQLSEDAAAWLSARGADLR